MTKRIKTTQTHQTPPQTIHLHHLFLAHGIPKYLKKLELYFSDRVIQKCFTQKLTEQKINPNILTVVHTRSRFGSDGVHDDSIQSCFDIKVERLTFGYNFDTGNRIIINNDDLHLLSNNQRLNFLMLCGIIFDKSCNNFDCFRNNKLKSLFLINCNIYDEDIRNLMSNHCGDEIIEQLAITKTEGLFNVKELLLNRTLITTACFKHMNVLQLRELDISGRDKLFGFDQLNIPTLTQLDANDVLSDSDMPHVLKLPITHLNLPKSSDITDKTLQHIFDHGTKLKELNITETSMTLDSMINFLSGQKLEALKMSKTIFDKDKLLDSQVITQTTKIIPS